MPSDSPALPPNNPFHLTPASLPPPQVNGSVRQLSSTTSTAGVIFNN